MNHSLHRNSRAFYWHAALLAVTVTFTDINTILPSLILGQGGSEVHVGIMTAIMVGVPLGAQLLFAGWLHTRSRKKPALLGGIYLRVASLAGLALLLFLGGGSSLSLLLISLYSLLLLFTLGGAFAGVSYIDLVGKSFPSGDRQKFVLRRQLVMSMGILLSALLTRHILASRGANDSYPLLFALSAASLLLASLGFWFLREKPVVPEGDGETAGSILRKIPEYLRKDPTLRRYVISANLLGFGTVLLPFYVALANRMYDVSPRMLGNLVLIQIGGMVLGNLIWHRVVKRFGFKGMLRVWSALGCAVPILALIAARIFPFQGFLPVFILTGLYLGAQKMTDDAVLMEISTDKNRALYSRIFGTFNISLAVFPLIIGGLISVTGYTVVFLFVAAAAATALLFIQKMLCPVDVPHNSPLSDDIVRE